LPTRWWLAASSARPRRQRLGLCLLGTLVCAIAGSALGALFAQPLVRSRAIAVLGLASCAVVTIPLGASPAVSTARALDVAHAAAVPSRLGPTLASVALFALAVAFTCVLLWRRRE